MGIKISALPAIVTPALTDVFPVAQGGITYKETITQLQALLGLSTVTTTGVQNQSYSYAADSGSADAYVATMSPAVLNYTAGQRFDLLITNTNTTASTLNINGLGAKSILRDDGTSLVAGDLIAGMISTFEYNGTAFQLINPSRRLLGTATNNSAVAGYVGEYISSTVNSGAAVPATSTVNLNVTSISLTAGDWDASANIFTSAAAGTTTTGLLGSISQTSATAAGPGGLSILNGISVSAGNSVGMALGTLRISLATTTTIYLVASVLFATSTLGVYGFIGARRAR